VSENIFSAINFFVRKKFELDYFKKFVRTYNKKFGVKKFIFGGGYGCGP